MRRRVPGLALALAALAAAARAHDFWIEPSTFHPDPGTTVAVSLRVGQDFRGEPVPRNPAVIERFVLVSERAETPIDGLPGADPAGEIALPSAGLYWIAYRSGRSPVTLDAEKFEKYLEEEGLEAVSEARRKGDQGKPGREVFSRSVKSLVVAGATGPAANGFDRKVGLTFELVLGKDPGKAVPGSLPLTLLYQGRPLPGALVVAMEQSSPGAARAGARSDAKGQVALPLSRKGVWLVKAVHMVPAPAGVDADWESIWTSLTFEVR